MLQLCDKLIKSNAKPLEIRNVLKEELKKLKPNVSATAVPDGVSSYKAALHNSVVVSRKALVRKNIHQAEEGGGGERFFCSHCQKQFPSNALLQRHMKHAESHMAGVSDGESRQKDLHRAKRISSLVHNFLAQLQARQRLQTGNTMSLAKKRWLSAYDKVKLELSMDRTTIMLLESYNLRNQTKIYDKSKILFEGSKLFWPSDTTVELHFFLHDEAYLQKISPWKTAIIEVIGYDPLRGHELPRLYLSYNMINDYCHEDIRLAARKAMDHVEMNRLARCTIAKCILQCLELEVEPGTATRRRLALNTTHLHLRNHEGNDSSTISPVRGRKSLSGPQPSPSLASGLTPGANHRRHTVADVTRDALADNHCAPNTYSTIEGQVGHTGAGTSARGVVNGGMGVGMGVGMGMGRGVDVSHCFGRSSLTAMMVRKTRVVTAVAQCVLLAAEVADHLNPIVIVRRRRSIDTISREGKTNPSDQQQLSEASALAESVSVSVAEDAANTDNEAGHGKDRGGSGGATATTRGKRDKGGMWSKDEWGVGGGLSVGASGPHVSEMSALAHRAEAVSSLLSRSVAGFEHVAAQWRRHHREGLSRSKAQWIHAIGRIVVLNDVKKFKHILEEEKRLDFPGVQGTAAQCPPPALSPTRSLLRSSTGATTR